MHTKQQPPNLQQVTPQRPRRVVAALLASLLLAPVGAQETRPWSFAVLGHLRGDPGENANLNPLVRDIVADARRLQPDMAFLCGDLVWGDYNHRPTDTRAVTTEWDALDGALKPLGIPVHRTPGNHDINDLATRDIFRARYPMPPFAVKHRGSLFLVLRSAWIPADGDTRKSQGVHGLPIDATQVAWLTQQLAASAEYDNIFVFVHHLLWWDEDAPWWHHVHPLLAANPRVRAVFGGDYGPTKFSRVKRDSVEYVHCSIETPPNTERLRGDPAGRALSAQYDCWLCVTVNGPTFRVDVRPVGMMTTDRYTPARHRELNELDPASFIWHETWSTTGRKRQVAGGLIAIGVVAGIVLTLAAWGIVARIRRRRAAAAKPGSRP